ncbi:hypothetical protein [uncultured Maritimibacter sp.]|uniref:hypothetical protein n=1 Tax=uncultured Maritimibacter sp. TaxID=991866 RepID=UPI0025935E82|nr:hypothetical protein [uncultured Maritimibacter sp.]
MTDIVERADGFRLGVDPTPDDVNEANWLIDRMTAEIEHLRADRDRLDFLDECNARLNEKSGTKYGWKMVMNHNVNRLMTQKGHLAVDLNDADAVGVPSCRKAIDGEMARIAVARAALTQEGK